MSLTLFAPTPTPSKAELTVESLKTLMAACQGDRLMLLTIYLDGKTKFINTLLHETRGLAIDRDMAESVWGWIAYRAGEHPVRELHQLQAQAQAEKRKQEAIDSEIRRLATAAKHNLRTNGDQHFDGEKVTTGHHEDWEPEKAN